MSPVLHQLILAVEGAEGVSADHLAAKLAVPLGIVFFCGSVFALLWSNFGAKKGALIYGTAFGGFCFMLGIFWWFGAPGTPVATGLTNFPGQEGDRYQAAWYPFETGSARADMFGPTSDLPAEDAEIPDGFQTVQESVGLEGASEEELESDPMFAAVSGDVNGASQLMVNLFLRSEGDQIQLGGERRAEYEEVAEAELADMDLDVEELQRADPFFTAEVDGPVLLGSGGDVPLAAAQVAAFANYLDDGETVRVQVDSQPVFAFKQESNLWVPSAVWTGVWFLVFLASLGALDRMERREKEEVQEAQEPERLAVPINQ